MDVFQLEPDTTELFDDMSIEDLTEFVNLHASPDFDRSGQDDSSIELFIYACFLVFTKTASIQALDQGILSAEIWVQETPNDHVQIGRRVNILDTLVARKLQAQTEQQHQTDTGLPMPESDQGTSIAQIIRRSDYKPMPPHPMLCSTCILMLGKIQPMRDVFPAISTSFDQIYLSGTVRYCAICSTFAEAVKKPASSLHVIHQDWTSSIRENREPKELILGFIVDVSGVLGGSVVRSSGEPLIFSLRNRLKVMWSFAEGNRTELKSDDDLTFLLSPWSINQPQDTSMMYLQTREKSIRTGRVPKSENCPFCEPANNFESSSSSVSGRPQVLVQSVDGALKNVTELDGALMLNYPRHTEPPSVNTGDDTSWERAIEWLDECATKHTKCQSKRELIRKEWHPTRLLDLNPPTPSHDDDLRLVLRDEDSPSGEYMTLSHCWGKSRLLNLTNDTLERFRQRIALDELSKTFQDAVAITRRLGIRYLWIDSLCIIQGDEADWQRESSTMGKVYSRSFLNIGATGAVDGSVGCFRERDHVRVGRPVVLKPDCMTHEEYYQPYQVVEQQFLERNLLAQPLLQRGWVFQERFLTSRMLHFGSEQLFWECGEMTTCETFPAHLAIHGQNRSFMDADFIKQVGTGSSKKRGGGQNGGPPTGETGSGTMDAKDEALQKELLAGQRLRLWYDIVAEYSTKQFTMSYDKLIALSGVAQQYVESWSQEAEESEEKEERYLAGLWKSDICRGLLWNVINGAGTRAQKWRAPTWSWASLDGCVEIKPNIDSKPLCEVYEAQIELVNEEYPFGSLKSAVLPIRGKLIPAVAVTTRKNHHGGEGEEDSYGLEYEGVPIPRSTWFPDEAPDINPKSASTSISASGGPVKESKVLCLPIIKSATLFGREPGFAEPGIAGLTIKLLQGKDEDEDKSVQRYVRTGYFSIMTDDNATAALLRKDTPFHSLLFDSEGVADLQGDSVIQLL